MIHYRSTFMGNVGFEELKKYTKQGTEFGKELVNILGERAQLEQNYAKGLKKLGQRISKATTLVLGSALTAVWRTVGNEMEKEAQLHSEIGNTLVENCVKPLSTLTDRQAKSRRMVEQQVEATGKTWTERYAEHTKIKKRLHMVTRENESLLDQIHGPRPKTDKDQQKLIAKQQKQEEALQRADSEYYSSLIQLEMSREEFESASLECCDVMEAMDDEKFKHLCNAVKTYGDNLNEIPSKMKAICGSIDKVTDALSPSDEILLVSEKLRGAPYTSEQILCDYYQENFNCQMTLDRRRSSVSKLLERYISDSQKERQHRDGLAILEQKTNASDLSAKLEQSSALLRFFDIIRFKLNCALASIDGRERPQNSLSNYIQHHTDKQGIIHSILRLNLGDINGKATISHKKSVKAKAPTTPSLSHHHSTISGRNSLDIPELSDQQRHSLERKSKSFSVNSKRQAPRAVVTNRHFSAGDASTEICKCVAIYNYVASRDDEISIQEGDVIRVFEKGVDNWWRGEVNGQFGLFPANYVDGATSP